MRLLHRALIRYHGRTRHGLLTFQPGNSGVTFGSHMQVGFQPLTHTLYYSGVNLLFPIKVFDELGVSISRQNFERQYCQTHD